MINSKELITIKSYSSHQIDKPLLMPIMKNITWKHYGKERALS